MSEAAVSKPSVFKRIETYISEKLEIQEPNFPKETNYENIAKHLIASRTASVNYYRTVGKIGIFGLVISILFFLALIVCHSKKGSFDLSILFEVKVYPAIIWSLITMSFGHIEMEGAKKELYEQLRDIAMLHKANGDSETIVDEYKKWTWTEFQDKFKPEKS